ncbi:ABC transporter permease [Hoeflea sp. EC-HK425]|uniref:ABC transporter permease n=1 Tax=Hoeflea sp. EC-HK425 TaxID=2038388 RepID=UPI001250D066|nr:ABC transporter permease [Hoeflea sp. EC-HK425]VVT12275.1 Nickel/cobalt efflux system [Hoeflea sp. EC-HK425]
MLSFIQHAIGIQREIYHAFADRIKAYAETGDWSQLAVFLPMGILFGAVHAMTPGHSKTVLAAYTAGTGQDLWPALRLAFVLSAVHIGTSIIIVTLALPLVSVVLGSAGRAYFLENLSRGLIGLIGVWMIWQAFRLHHRHGHAGQGLGFAVVAGLIPCPLTLFVMTFAASRGVTEAGLAFALVMLMGVASVLGLVAVTAAVARKTLSSAIGKNSVAAHLLGVALQVATGLFLIGVAYVMLAS